MNPSTHKRFGVLALTLALTACAELDQLMAGLQQSEAPHSGAATGRPAAHISDTLQKMCQEAAQNKLRATALYEEKILTARGVVGLIQEGLYTRKDLVGDEADHYSVLVNAAKTDRTVTTSRADDISIHARSNDRTAVNRLSKGQTVQVSGIVMRLSFNALNGCAITLADATFL